MHRPFVILSALGGFVAVAAGAFGAHALQQRLDPRMLTVFETAVRYQFYHTLALLALGLCGASARLAGSAIVAGWCFVVGILVFSGSLYLMVFTGMRWLGAVTPIGGMLFMIGWALLAWSAFRAR